MTRDETDDLGKCRYTPPISHVGYWEGSDWLGVQAVSISTIRRTGLHVAAGSGLDKAHAVAAVVGIWCPAEKLTSVV